MIILPVWSSSSSPSPTHHATPTIKSEEIQQPQKSVDKTVLDYLLESIMGFPMDSEVKQALFDAGMRSPLDLFTMEIDLLSQLTYKVGTERERLRLLDVSKLRKIGSFHDALCDRENVYALSVYQWETVDSNDWREYCMNPKSFTGGSKPSATMKAATTTLRDNFAKSIKKHPRLILLSRKPGSGIHGIESFTARRICTI